MKKLKRIIAVISILSLFSLCICANAEKISDEKRLRQEVEDSIFESGEVVTKPIGVGKSISPERRKAIVELCDRRIGLLTRISGRGDIVKGTVLLVAGGYIGAGGLRTKSYEASQLRRSMNPSDLKYNVDLLIRVYTSIRGEYSDTAPVPKACDAQHTSRHFLHTREGRKGFRSEHRK